MNRAPHVSIILVNWNRLHDTLACLRSCLALDWPSFDILVVDNGSDDGSPDALAAALDGDARVAVLPAESNLGYAGGNNLGISRALDAGADFVWLLNNDTIVNPATLRALLEAAAERPRAGIFGSKIHYMDRPDTLCFAGGRVERNGLRYSKHRGVGEIDRGQYDRIQAVEYVTGASLLARAATVRNIGLLDERYFLYWEDVDWCTRAWRAGWSCLYVPGSTLLHRVGASSAGRAETQQRYEARNRLRYQWRFDRPGALAVLTHISLTYLGSCWRGDQGCLRGELAGALDFVAGRSGRIES